jgi:hypothetical protein
MKALSQATLAELALAGAVRGYALHGQVECYVLSGRSCLSEAVSIAAVERRLGYARSYGGCLASWPGHRYCGRRR